MYRDFIEHLITKLLEEPYLNPEKSNPEIFGSLGHLQMFNSAPLEQQFDIDRNLPSLPSWIAEYDIREHKIYV